MPIVYQNFDALTVGQTTVPGWIVGAGGGSVVATGVKLGINTNAGNAWHITEGTLLFDQFLPVDPISVWFEWKNTAPFGVGKMCSFGLWDLMDQNNFIEFGWLTQEADYSFSVYAAGNVGAFGTGLLDNTGLHTAESEGQVRQMRAIDRWGTFFECDVTLGIATIGGVDFITFGIHVFADGINILSGTQTTSIRNGAPLGTLGGVVSAACNWVSFFATGPLNAADLDEITIDTGVSGPTYPHPGVSPHVKATQGIAEINILPTTAQVRATQGVIEANLLPTTASIRITQAVIELLTTGSSTGGGPEYIKRRVPGSS